MHKILIQIPQNMELIKRMTQDENPMEYWSARDLMSMLGYSAWRMFLGAVERAKVACNTSGYLVADHFVDADKMIGIGSKTKRKMEDIYLTRYACYLIAQNGDPRKPQIALAQTYFASQTRRQELLEQREREAKRLKSRAMLTNTEKKNEGTVYKSGITLPREFATFKNKHVADLFGGFTET